MLLKIGHWQDSLLKSTKMFANVPSEPRSSESLEFPSPGNASLARMSPIRTGMLDPVIKEVSLVVMNPEPPRIVTERYQAPIQHRWIEIDARLSLKVLTHSRLFNDVHRGSSECKLREQLRPLKQTPQRSGFKGLFGDDYRIARIQAQVGELVTPELFHRIAA